MGVNLLDRRRFLALGGGAAVTVAATSLAQPASALELDADPFTLGVASGDPAHDSVVLWTRLAPEPLDGGGMPDTPVEVRWEIARDEDFRHVVNGGTTKADPRWAHSVHVIADGLAPDRWYWYRFEANGVRSRVGRTRTLPAPGVVPERMRFAIASCQAWTGGAYASYRDMAEQELDFVLHLGDYIYETVDGSLEEFRRLHSLYKTSPDLREAHARFPFITTWDDHEVLNNWADNHKSSPDGRPFEERRENGFQAYYEHLPMRTAPTGPDYPIYRGFRWGRLAEFSVLDTRQYRDAQACGDGMNTPPCDEVYEEDRTMTGPEQERWLIEGLRKSRSRWTVIAQQTILARFDYDVGPGLAYNLDQAVRQGLPVNPHVKFYNGSFRGYQLFDVTPERWEATLRIVLNAGDAASPAYTIAAFEVRDGQPGPRRLDDGDGIIGTVLDGDENPLSNVEILIRTEDGSVVVTSWTDPAGEYLAFAAPGTYTIEASAVGYEPASTTVTVEEGAPTRADFTLARSTEVFAETGRRVPGPITQGSPEDIVIGNELVAMTVAAVTEDGQLPNATRGKPIDMASVGHLDQIDWFNLPFVAADEPNGTEAWQRGLVGESSVEVVSVEPEEAIVRTTGSALEVDGVAVTTVYTARPGQSWVHAHTTVTNNGAESRTVWVGDVIDHDGPGQRSGVPGHGTITTPYGEPGAFEPAGPWVGMTGGDGQTYALVYPDADFRAYGNGNWIQSQYEVSLAAGASWTFERRIVAVDNGGDEDPWAVLEDL